MRSKRAWVFETAALSMTMLQELARPTVSVPFGTSRAVPASGDGVTVLARGADAAAAQANATPDHQADSRARDDQRDGDGRPPAEENDAGDEREDGCRRVHDEEPPHTDVAMQWRGRAPCGENGMLRRGGRGRGRGNDDGVGHVARRDFRGRERVRNLRGEDVRLGT